MARLLITNCAPEGGGVYVVDSATGKIATLHEGIVRGACRTGAGIFCVENDGVVHQLDPDSGAGQPVAATGLSGCHDIRFIDNCFYLVACRGNRVVRFSSDWRRLDEMQIVEHEGDVCHANCLIPSQRGLLLTIFTLQPGVREEKNQTEGWRYEGKVLRLEWPHRWEIWHEPLAQPHSLVERPEGVYVCESLTSELSLLSDSAGTVTRRPLLTSHGFLRGLVFSEGRLFAGVSVLRRNVPLQHRLKRFQKMPCGLLEIDPATWKVRRQIPTPGSAIYEVLDLDAPLE